MQRAVFGAGCFWRVQVEFDAVPGVEATCVGYAGGAVAEPTYQQVCTDKTGHAEVIEIIFDPNQVSYTTLLKKFFEMHDPTQLNRQGPDIGTQYRSVIFVSTEAQSEEAHAMIAEELQHRHVVTRIEELAEFWPAEDYHQKYLEKRGQTSCSL